MKKDEVIEIADSLNGSLNFYEWHYAFANEVERRTLERAAVLSETTYSNGDGVEGWFKIIAENIRALKEEVK